LSGRPSSRAENTSSIQGSQRDQPPALFAGETTVLALLLVAVLLAAPLMLGSVHRWAQGVLLALCVPLAIGLCLAPTLKFRAIPWFGVVLCACALFIGLQAIPLPSAWVRILSPNTAQTYRESLSPELLRRFHPLSLDGPATAVEVAKALVFAVVFAACVALGRREKVRRRLGMALVGTGLVVALIGYGHQVANLDRLFGFYRFKDVSPSFLSTLANKNNLAGLFCLCAPPALALALSTRERRRAILWGICYVLIGTAVFLTLSRGGMIAFVLGQLLFAVLLPRSVASLGVRAVLFTLALFIAGYLALGQLMGKLATLTSVAVTREHTFGAMIESLPMLRDFPLVGIGRGAFPNAGARYIDVPLGTAEYVENEILQPLIDLGWLMGGLLLVSASILWWKAVRPRLRRMANSRDVERSPLIAGLAAGLASLFVQNQVDFSMEIPGVAVPAVVALGLLSAEAYAARRSTRRGLHLQAGVIGAFALALAPAAAFGLWYGRHDWRFEVDAFSKRAAVAPDFPSIVEEANPLLRRHPASFVVPLALASRALRELPPSRGASLAIHFTNRALDLKPSSPDGHLVAAQALAALGHKDQSLLETRLYFEASGGDDRGLREAMNRFPALEDLMKAVPATTEGLRGLNRRLQERDRWADALFVAEAWRSLAPQSEEAHRECGRALKVAGRTEEAERELRQAVALAAEEPAAVAELATLLQETGRSSDSREVLSRGLLANPGDLRLSLDLAHLELRAGRPEAAAGALRQARVAGPVERGKVLELNGDVEGMLGHGNRAFSQYDQAAALAPGSSAPWKAVDQLERMSRFEEAQTYLRRLRVNASPEMAEQIDSRIGHDAQRGTEQRLSREGAAREAAQKPHEVEGEGGKP
jgi:tetratricopeptide (TPR) repeat protein